MSWPLNSGVIIDEPNIRQLRRKTLLRQREQERETTYTLQKYWKRSFLASADLKSNKRRLGRCSQKSVYICIVRPKSSRPKATIPRDCLGHQRHRMSRGAQFLNEHRNNETIQNTSSEHSEHERALQSIRSAREKKMKENNLKVSVRA